MKTFYTLTGAFLISALVTTASLAQRSFSRWSNYDAITTYRIGTQGVNLGALNQALQQAGYNTLPGQLTVLSIASQFSKPNRALALHSELGLSVNSFKAVTNGTYKAKAGFYYFKVGTSYRILGSDKFQLAPQLSVLTLPFHVGVKQINNTSPSLNSILANPGSAQTATFYTGSVGAEVGLMANLRIPYGRQWQMDCSTMERSFVIGLDAGYRFATRASLDGNEISSNSPSIQLSGLYAGIRLGFGIRVRSTKTPITY